MGYDGVVSAPDPALLATMSEDDLARTLRMSPSSLADVMKTVAANPGSTIEPTRASSDAPGMRALEVLGEQRGGSSITKALAVGATIGEGGMGIVRVALQKSLDRQVAVKTVRKDAQSRSATLRLLREAWITGSLEHPNIVPIYDLGLDEDGSPIIVLKRIEGVEWATVVHDADAVRERFGAADLLEYNLRILVQLCNAVGLAHSRGVLHRDLKPENVMIGRFGEVYLVDWGIAVSVRDDPSGRLPLAKDAVDMAGTPAYMAPEMLGSTLGKLSERTDVYLLGAVLHEILTGTPPHHRDEFRAIVVSILTSEPTYGPDVPAELADIARRAMARDVSARFGSADEMRQRLEWYLRHRGSLALSRVALERVAQLRDLVEPASTERAGVRDRIHRLVAEARFGFRQALAASEDNAVARDGLREAITLVADYELRRGRPEAASAALAEIDDAPADLVARVAEAMRLRGEEKRKLARLEKLDAQLDPSTGRRTRMTIGFLVGALWTVMPQAFAWYERTHDVTSTDTYMGTFAVVAPSLALYLWGRESMTKTAINRRIIAATGIMFAGVFAIEVGCHLLRIPKETMPILLLLHFGIIAAMISVNSEARLFPAAFVYVAAFFVAAVRPDWRWHLMSAADFFLMVNFVAAWYSHRDDVRYMRARLRARLLRMVRRATR